MSDSHLVNEVVETTLESNPELVEEYHNDVHGALNDLIAKANEYSNDRVPNPVLIVEFKEQLNN